MDRKTQLAREIEVMRKKLHRSFYGSNGKITSRIKSLSCKLDQLIVEYIKNR